MAVVVTVMNMKGGVGKTTIAAHLSGMLAMYRWNDRPRRVLAIDYDPQFSLSQMFIPAEVYFGLEAQRKTSLAILQDDETQINPFTLQVPSNLQPPPHQALVHPIYSPSESGTAGVLDLIPATLNLMYLALGQPITRTSVFEERFRKFINGCRDDYDVIVIDCHPAGSIFTKTSLQNSDHILIPVAPNSFAARGVALMREFTNSANSGLATHILFNYTTSIYTPKQQEEEQIIRANPRHQRSCTTTPLRYYKVFSDPREGDGFVWYSKAPYSTQAYENLRDVVAELVGRMDL